MRMLRGVIAVVVGVVLLLPTTPVRADTLPYDEPPHVFTSDVFITAFQTVPNEGFGGTNLSVVELYNAGNVPVEVSSLRIEAQSVNGVVCELTVASSGQYILPRSYAPLASVGALGAENPDVQEFTGLCGVAGETITKLVLESATGIDDTIDDIPLSGAFNRRGVTATYRDNDPFASNFIALSATSGTGARGTGSIYTGGWYVPPSHTPLTIVELFPDASSCAPNDSAPTCSDYVKLYNPTNQVIDMSMYRLRTGSYGTAATASNTMQLSGALSPDTYMSFGLSLSESGNWVWLEDTHGVKLYDDSVVNYPPSNGHTQEAWSLHDSNVWRWTRYPTPGSQPNQFTSGAVINYCSGLRLSEIAANHSSQFIEVYNASNSVIDVSGCQIQTNRSQTKSFIFSENSSLPPREHRAIKIADTELTLTKTTTGVVYLLDSEGNTEIDAQSYEDLRADTSWALIDNQWKQTYTVTPNALNVYAQHPPCESGYYRNMSTGYCNKIATASTLTPCRTDQYRSPETNRCRSTASSASTLKQCDANQYRNPETNRCRLIASTASALKPCAPNQERNPATNRCRAVMASTIPTADYALEETNSGSSPIGWLAFAGVGGLAIGYGVWEWRRELAGLVGGVIGKLKR